MAGPVRRIFLSCRAYVGYLRLSEVRIALFSRRKRRSPIEFSAVVDCDLQNQPIQGSRK